MVRASQGETSRGTTAECQFPHPNPLPEGEGAARAEKPSSIVIARQHFGNSLDLTRHWSGSILRRVNLSRSRL
jgi:hypothetical protein